MRYPQPDPERARHYRQTGCWRDDTIHDLIAAQATTQPDKIAVRDAAGASLTYGALMAQSTHLAGFLAARGVGPGDVVSVCLPNWCQTVVAFLATLHLGAVINPLATTYGHKDLAFALGKCRSKALFIAGRFRSADYTDMVATVDSACTADLTVVRLGDGAHNLGTPYEDAIAHAALAHIHPGSADAACAVLFTSGTESQAKGVVHTHNTILFGERALAAALHASGDDVAFMASPLSHATGFLHGFVMTLTTGATLSLLDIFSGPAAAAQMRAHDCTWTMGATPFLVDTIAALAASGQTLPKLRYFLCGGAPVPEMPVRAAADVGVRVLSIYGASESPPHTIVHPEDPLENSWLSDGRPLAGIEVRIVDAHGNAMPPGEIGEEWSRGPNTFLGYLDEPQMTAKALDADGWVHSGDLARRLPDGSIRIAGRLKDIIVRGGQNISVAEVEGYIAAHPAVKMVAVVGEHHPRLGETACAVVVPASDQIPTLEELTAFLVEKGIAKFKLPERLELWPSLPTTPSGKIQKFIIRQKLNQGTTP